MRTSYRRLLCALLLATGLQVLLVPTSSAQFKWPDQSENLQVLPETTSGEQLSNIMRGWTRALGVRCSHCHVGQGPLTEYDFVSDEKEAKEKTREMIRMTRAINSEYIAKFADLEQTEEERVNVTCTTCHRNVAKPMPLEVVLTKTYGRGGIEEALSHYDELREAYYGGYAYDFREGVLTRLGQQLIQQENNEAAMEVLNKEIELYPDFADPYVVQGQIWAEMGNTENALASYEKGKALASPRGVRVIQELIDTLNNQ